MGCRRRAATKLLLPLRCCAAAPPSSCRCCCTVVLQPPLQPPPPLCLQAAADLTQSRCRHCRCHRVALLPPRCRRCAVRHCRHCAAAKLPPPSRCRHRHCHHHCHRHRATICWLVVALLSVYDFVIACPHATVNALVAGRFCR
jgi:hypothetical protein